MMKWLVFSIAALLLAGCDFTVPLSGKPEVAIDERAVGLWERTTSRGRTERLLILPLNNRQYFVSWPEGANTEIYAKAHLFEFSGMQLVQLEWFGNSDGGVPDDRRIYQVATYALTDEGLEIRLLNADITGKDFSAPEDLAEAVKNNSDNPGLFRKPMTYRKVRT